MSCKKSLLEPGHFEINVRRSRFVGDSARCECEEEAKSFIKSLSQRYASADHCCWAYRISLQGREIANYSDAGEPHGSAGKPILGAIESLELTDVVVVVTRYFGGTKLGVRGLIDAYGETAAGALRAGKLALYCPGLELVVEMTYSQWNDFIRLFGEDKDFSVRKVDYSERVFASLAVQEKNIERITGFLEDRRIFHKSGEELSFVSPLE